MGFFSWRTMDTDRSIANQYSNRKPFTVVMVDDKGNKWFEQNYEGYGVFGGKDYYELLAEMNGVVERDKVQLQGQAYTDYMRMKGIDMAFGSDAANIKYPNLVENASGWPYQPHGPEDCKDQGYFYSDESEDDDYFETDPEEKYWKNVTTYSERNSVTDEDLW